MDHKQYQKKILLELMKLEEFNEYFDPIQKVTSTSQDKATIKKILAHQDQIHTTRLKTSSLIF